MQTGLPAYSVTEPLRVRHVRPAGPSLVPSVTRAMALLERIAEQGEPMSLTRLAIDLALPKSSVHGLCSTLLSMGYLRRQQGGVYVIGPRIMPLAEAFVAGTNVVQEFSALWNQAGWAPDETVILSVLNGPEVVYVAARNGARPLGLAFNVGMRLPAHLAATGKAMLAFHDAGDLRALFPNEALPRMVAGKGAASFDELTHELAQVRSRGHSIDDGSIREGVYCLGAAVLDVSGHPVAGIGVCLNRAMLGGDRGEKHRDMLLRAARLLSQRMGGESELSEMRGKAKHKVPQ